MAEKVPMIALSPTMDAGTIVRWIKREGESVAAGDVLCEVETDKATMEYESAQAGTLLKILVADGGQARIGDPIAVVGEPGEEIAALLGGPPSALPAALPAAPPAAALPLEPRARSDRLRASPLARRLAAEMGMELRGMTGSGPGGRIVKRDLIRGGKKAEPASRHPPDAERVPISGMRRAIARRMAGSKFSAPHYYLKIDVAAGRLLEARERMNREAAESEKVSFNAFLIKMCAEALKRHPRINSGWSEEAILRFRKLDIALAVAMEDGLLAPVVRDCGAKGIRAIDGELKVLIEKARSGRLDPEAYSGATFTISNLGSYGILDFTAIINPPGAAILAVGKIQPDYENRMILTLSCDHRVVDGAVGASFLAELKGMIEDPFRVLY